MLGHTVIGQVALGQLPATASTPTARPGRTSQHITTIAQRDHLDRLRQDDETLVLILALTA